VSSNNDDNFEEDIYFDLTPAADLLGPTGIGAVDLGLGGALNEIVANSLDWSLLSEEEVRTLIRDASLHNEAQVLKEELEAEYGDLSTVTSKEPIQIEITNDEEKITIVDNGVGMISSELQDALQLKKSSDVNRTPLRKRKGQFGMGLKVSALSLGLVVEIYTRSIKDPGYTVYFPLMSEEMVGRDDLRGLKGTRTGKIDPNSPLGDRTHGTAIVISKLKKGSYSSDDFLDAREELCDFYHYALIGDEPAEIRINGSVLVATTPDMNPDVPLLKLDDFELFVREDLGGGRRGEKIQIRGWAGVMKKAKISNFKYGFHTFRKNQLIEAFHNDGFKASPPGLWPYPAPHSEIARLFGHIHLDMVPPNFHKKGWNNVSPAWEEAVRVLEPVLENLVKLARDTTKDVKKNKDLLGAYTRFVKTGEWVVPKKKSRRRGPKDSPGSDEPEPTTAFNIDGFDYDFLSPNIGNDYDDTKPPWTYIVDHDSHEIQMTLYMQHPLYGYAKKDGHNVLNKMAQIDVFCQMMQDMGHSVATIQGKRELLYREVFDK